MRSFGQFGLFRHFWCTFYRFKYFGLVPKFTNISYDNFLIHKRVTLNNDVNKVAKAEFAFRFFIERVESIENINHCHSPLTQIILPLSKSFQPSLKDYFFAVPSHCDGKCIFSSKWDGSLSISVTAMSSVQSTLYQRSGDCFSFILGKNPFDNYVTRYKLHY